MSVFAPTENPNDTHDQVVENLAFFPAIAVADFRAAQRLQDSVDSARVVWALRGAVIDTNRALAAWRATQEARGHATLAGVPADRYGPISVLEHHYRRAVYANAKALLIEYYRDADTREEGLERFIEMTDPIDVCRREVRYAIRDLLGLKHLAVELI